MAISVVDKSVSMKSSTGLSVNPPIVNTAQRSAKFTCGRIEIDGECELAGSAGDNPAGWTLGLIQLQWIETNWGWYRGQTEKDGSIFEQRARPPARPQQGCRDTLNPGEIFYWDSEPSAKVVIRTGQQLPIKMKVKIPDSPEEPYDLVRNNSRTGKPNYLYKVQLEFHFCTVLTLMSPARQYQFLKHLLWNVHWEYEFQPTNYGNPFASPWTARPTSGGSNRANVSRVFDGGPTEPKFSTIIIAPGTPNCNAVAHQAAAARNLKESSVWELFSVTR